MKPEELIEIMNEIPDTMLISANSTRFRRRGSILYLIPAIAACLLVGITALLYPKLRTRRPDVKNPTEETGSTASVQTTVTGTDASDSTSVCSYGTQLTETTASAPATDSSSGAAAFTTASSDATETCTTQTASQTTAQSTARTTVTSGSSHSSGIPTNTEMTRTDMTIPGSVIEEDTKTRTGTAGTAVSSDIGDSTEETLCSAYAEEPLPFRILRQRTVSASEEPLPCAAQSKLYRSALPEEYPANLFPRINFETEDCLVIRFRANGRGAGQAELIESAGDRYSIRLITAPADAGTVQEFVIAAAIPKSLYSAALPDGARTWRLSAVLFTADTTMQCLIQRY